MSPTAMKIFTHRGMDTTISIHSVSRQYGVSPSYTLTMPKLWPQTLASHKRESRDAILDATARLVHRHGLVSVTMSRIAEETGIGRATLYKYFTDVEAILRAWHERQISEHLRQLSQAAERSGPPLERLHAVLQAYASIARGARGHRDPDPAAFLHRDHKVVEGERRLHALLRELLTEGIRAGDVRDDIPPAEQAHYCLHALGAASTVHSTAGLRRLVELVVSSVRLPR
jgi:AcrR family transcriptional regulator